MARTTWIVLLLAGAAAAQDKKRDKAASPPAPLPPPVATQHAATIGGAPVDYAATAGYLPLVTDDGKTRAEVFHIAYMRRGVADVATRPITFVFNGGPGSSSVWLHLGTVGPRRVAMSDAGEPLPPPGRAVSCAESWLDVTDLVFVDPVGTGYSRPAKGHKQKEFSGLKEDTESVGEFIRLFTTQARRWASPKFLAGESYGTTRAASLAGRLQDRYGMYLSGIVLVSPVLNFQTIRFGRGNDLPYPLILPAYTATAWYHKRLAPELLEDRARTLREAEEFALTDYVVALAKGDALPADARAAVAKRMARLTGLAEAFVERSDLRVGLGRFAKELLRDRRRTVGRLDSRYLGIDRDGAGSHYDYDPSMAAINGPYSAAVKHYLRTELRFETDRTYETLSGRVRPWSFRDHENRYVDVAGTLRDAMTKNRHLKVLVCAGLYDLATPYFAAEYTVRHLGLDPDLKGHVRVRRYDAGHMMYVHEPSRVALKRDVAAFYAWALGGGEGAGG